MEATAPTNFDIDYSRPEAAEPFQDILIVKNHSSAEHIVWPADGKIIRLPPGGVGRMRRWQFMLGLKQPNAFNKDTGDYHLKELNEEEGTIAYREARAAAAEAEVKRVADELEAKKAELAKARKDASTARAKIDVTTKV